MAESSPRCRRTAVAWGGAAIGLALVSLLIAYTCSSALHAQGAAADGVYTEDQAKRGDPVYQEQCSTCHGSDLKGGGAPPLAGGDFTAFWLKSPLSELVDKITMTMPATSPGSLSREQTADIVAYLLKVGKFPAGKTELPADAIALKAITPSK